ncbi:MAG: molecular chaperone DnaJ [Patescibacteria group bacterium]
MKDYYKILGIERGASDAEIKKAFRRKAQEYHPDKKGGDEKKFKEVNEAYSVLKDKKKRAQYDQFGQAGPGASYSGAGHGFGGFDFGGFSQGGMEFDVNDLFGDIFGGARRGARRRRGADISIELEINFKESVFGTDKEFSITKNTECSRCGGTGDENKKPKTCTTCNGDGQVSQVQQTIMGTIQRQIICPDCNGKGTQVQTKCSKCKGSGITREKEKVRVRIPAGIEDGQQLRMSGKGEALIGGEPGDLYILVRVVRDKRFEKIANDLKTDLEISIVEAVLGATKKVGTVDGEVKIKIPAGTNHGAMLRVKGEGVGEKSGRRGDLYVQISVSVPKKLSREERRLYEELQSLGRPASK